MINIYIYLLIEIKRIKIYCKIQNRKIFPGKIFIHAQFLDPEQPGEKSDISNILNNIEDKTQLLKGTLNSIPSKEKEKYLSSN